MNIAKATDGRTQRHNDNKRKTIETVLNLVMETGNIPNVEKIAEKAGVSRRSIFRFFHKFA